MASSFYASLPVCTAFEELLVAELYVPLPPDWHVLVADVRGSTNAIANGRYRDVNLVGASTIVAVMNACAPEPLAFTFGGDGASFAVSPAQLPAATEALHATRRMAADAFDLDLRVGGMPVQDLRAQGADVRVARLQLTDHSTQTMFTGGGLALADRLVKAPATAATYALPAPDMPPEADFSGLECRWNEIPSPQEENVTLLVEALGQDATDRQATYRRVLQKIETLYGTADRYRPLSTQVMLPSFSPERLTAEARVRTPQGGWTRFWYTAKVWAQNALLKWFVAQDITTATGRWRDYIDLLVRSSDFRKYDGLLRMVVAGTAPHRRQLVDWLDAQQDAGHLRFGHHVASHALITCVVFERMGHQIHFVDGARGGYALAARAMKRQAKQNEAPSQAA
ncbi:MAG: DUF3095 family protein [Bacteroidetes bacterium]|jgi:hypothetical protein|nr:DUF3095 family protein [Bacteroidota bacterium]